MRVVEFARLAVEHALSRKALDPVLLEVADRSTYTDYILIVSGRSERQLEAIADGIVEGLASHGCRPQSVEGVGTHWVLVDYGDFVVHVFLHPVREFFDLEGLWSDGARVHLDVPPEGRLSAAEAY